MSRQIDLTNPLSDEDRLYLAERGRMSDIAMADGLDASALSAGPSYSHDASPEELLEDLPNTGDVNTLGRDETGGAADLSGDDEEVESEYSNLPIIQLRNELERRDLSKTGPKADLVQRLEEDDEENGE